MSDFDLNAEEIEWNNSKYYHARLHAAIVSIHDNRMDKNYENYYEALYSLYMELVGLIDDDDDDFKQFERLKEESRQNKNNIIKYKNKGKTAIPYEWLKPMFKWEQKMRRFMDEQRLLVKKSKSDPF